VEKVTYEAGEQRRKCPGFASENPSWQPAAAIAFAVIMVAAIGALSPPGNVEARAVPNAPQMAGDSLAGHPLAVSVGTLVNTAHDSGRDGKKTIIPSGSNNWGGYALNASNAGTITEVTGEWHIPEVVCSEQSGVAWQVDWIGIDGWSSNTVEQVGSSEFCSAPGATPSYTLWYEFAPYEPLQNVSTVAAGAAIVGTVSYNPSLCYGSTCGAYTLQEIDLNDGAADFVYQGVPTTCDSSGCQTGPDQSAECISEAPLVSYGVEFQLAHYTTTTFYYCSATVAGHFAGIGSLPASVGKLYEITTYGHITDNVIQSTGGLKTFHDGKSEFVVTWKGYD